jgi:hypothetical protein
MCFAAQLATQLQAHLGLLVLQALPETLMDILQLAGSNNTG